MHNEPGESRRRRGLVAVALIALIGSVGAECAADAPDPMNRVNFQVESSRDVANDWIQAIAGITDEDVDAARLADRINTTMTRAMKIANAAPNVRVKRPIGNQSLHGPIEHRVCAPGRLVGKIAPRPAQAVEHQSAD